LRMVLAAVYDDDVFRAAAHEQIGAREIPQISCVEPSVPDRLRGQRLLLMVAQHHGGSRQNDLADPPLWEAAAPLIDDPDVMVRKHPTATDQRPRFRFASGAASLTPTIDVLNADPFALQSASARRERRREHMF